MKFHNSTIYGPKLLLKNRRRNLKKLLIFQLSFYVCVVIGASIYLNYIKMTQYIWIMWAILAFFLAVLLLINFFQEKKILNGNAENFIVNYEFLENSLLVSVSNSEDVYEIEYLSIKKIVDEEDYWCIYLIKKSAPFLVDIKGFDSEDAVPTLTQKFKIK